MKTLPITFSNEDIAKTIYNFIDISVKFWNQVIPPPQHEEEKYSIEIFSEELDYYSQIINLHYQSQNISLNISNEIIFDSIPEQIETSTNDQSCLDKSTISLISECIRMFRPNPNIITDFSLFEKLTLIKSFIESTIISPQETQPTFRLYLLQILKNFDSLTSFANCKSFQLLQIIREHSKRIYNKVFSLFTLLNVIIQKHQFLKNLSNYSRF
jgi:hypothetical protein